MPQQDFGSLEDAVTSLNARQTNLAAETTRVIQLNLDGEKVAEVVDGANSTRQKRTFGGGRDD